MSVRRRSARQAARPVEMNLAEPTSSSEEEEDVEEEMEDGVEEENGVGEEDMDLEDSDLSEQPHPADAAQEDGEDMIESVRSLCFALP